VRFYDPLRLIEEVAMLDLARPTIPNRGVKRKIAAAPG